MEPIELEVIMRDRTKDGVSGVTQSITNLEQTMEQATASFIADYDRQVEAVKRLETKFSHFAENWIHCRQVLLPTD